VAPFQTEARRRLIRLPDFRPGVLEQALGSYVAEKAAREMGAGLPTAHEMTLTRSLEPGVDEWSCAQCGRRLLIRRPPAFEKIVLERGDEWAAHVGGTGGLQVAAAGAQPPSPDLSPQAREWLADHGIEW
jgi:hypothetical protein